MTESGQNKKFEQLRHQYPVFTYEDFSWSLKEDMLMLRFHFNLGNRYDFFPEHTIDLKSWSVILPDDQIMDNLVFHIGMAELVSYWKAACSPTVMIKPYRLKPIQTKWWKKLYYQGLGEFFYLNKIITNQNDFLSFSYEKNATPVPSKFRIDLDDALLIPVGGGKDSVVTLGILASEHANAAALVINQRKATEQCIEKAGLEKNVFEVKRTIHSTLLELNEKGFLNGHTPFSSLLAFVSALAAVITGKKHIALSNESSANEATIPGTNINHQYSKSFEFEQDFRSYLFSFISPDINYFSFLRPLNELQIGALFSRNPGYFDVFRSCNVGSKTDTWCCNCSKCLFTYIMLSPFVEKSVMVKIFGEDLFENENLGQTLYQLAGLAPEKPFECVGTINEVNSALAHLCESEIYHPLPVLLKKYKKATSGIKFTSLREQLQYWNGFHSLTPRFEKLLKESLKTVQQIVL
ncbi:MAG: hypothetical protein K0B37_08825 [Bacteroidales bacterium]|nr:hypothetical protein [Bacteroidales bacterium]